MKLEKDKYRAICIYESCKHQMTIDSFLRFYDTENAAKLAVTKDAKETIETYNKNKIFDDMKPFYLKEDISENNKKWRMIICFTDKDSQEEIEYEFYEIHKLKNTRNNEWKYRDYRIKLLFNGEYLAMTGSRCIQCEKFDEILDSIDDYWFKSDYLSLIANEYVPEVKYTGNIELSKDMKELTEHLAKNVHEVWAHNRIKEGWVFGPAKNGELKTTPSLVPYEYLPEEEKDYDRNTVIETIKLIQALGYDIIKKYDAFDKEE